MKTNFNQHLTSVRSRNAIHSIKTPSHLTQQAFSWIFFILMGISLQTCHKNPDIPPLKSANTSPAINIAQLKQKFSAGSVIKFQSDSSLYGVITADETCGNLYHELYLKDATGGIHVGMTGGGGLLTGDSIRISLKGALLRDDNNLITIDSIHPETQIVKLASGWKLKPINVTMEQLLANTSNTNIFQSQLVAIPNVYFAAIDRDQLFANAISRTAHNRTLQSCEGFSIQIRTSGYSLLAGHNTPIGMGTITAIVTQYGNTIQLLLRTLKDVPLNNTICVEPTVLHSKNFNDNSISSGGWTIQNLVGNINWSIGTSGAPSPYAKISNYSNNTTPKNSTCDTWLISPIITPSNQINAILNFQYAYDFIGKKLMVYASEKYQAGKPQLSDWTLLDSVQGPPGFSFKSSTPIYLKIENPTRIAFRYQGSSTDGATWEIDDIKIISQN